MKKVYNYDTRELDLIISNEEKPYLYIMENFPKLVTHQRPENAGRLALITRFFVKKLVDEKILNLSNSVDLSNVNYESIADTLLDLSGYTITFKQK